MVSHPKEAGSSIDILLVDDIDLGHLFYMLRHQHGQLLNQEPRYDFWSI
jgi:hypothetical protein